VGTLVTSNRRYLRSRWLWGGALLSLVIWLPNLLWEFQNHWITLDFFASIHSRDVQAGQASTFLINQIEFNLNLVMLFLVIAGLYFYFFAPSGKRYRLMGWMYLVPFLLIIIAQGNGYYLAPAYPMLAASGAVWWGGRLKRMASPRWAKVWRRTTWGVLSVFALFVIAVELPVAPLGSAWWDFISQNNTQLKSEVGWPQLAQQVARVYNSLPDSEKTHAAILAASSGEVGSIDLYGPAYGLPKVISGFDSYWQFGYGNPPPTTVVVVGFPADLLEEFQTCTFSAAITMPFNVQNEETINHRAIYVCHNLRVPWPELWQHFQYFG
jgi:hypothetical protein